MNQGKVLYGVLTGIAVGATLGVLFAPRKGCKTRKQFINKGKSYVEEVKDKYNSIVDEAVEKLGTIKKGADGLHVD